MTRVHDGAADTAAAEAADTEAADAGRTAADAVARAFHEEHGRALATLIRVLGDFDQAEESVAQAYLLAMETWPRDGVPERPGAWIVTAARNHAIDRVRRARRFADRAEALAREEAFDTASRETALLDAAEDDVDPIPDDQLRLIFTCCHPALAPEASIALTLRTLGGLTTAEIAAAFLVPEATLAQRLVRAKRKIREAGIAYAVPSADRLPERLDAVLHVLYLIFNEGYEASTGARLVREDLCAEAIRLARVVAALLPGEPEALGALALMLLHDARRAARLGADGSLVLLEDQDRGSWDRAEIAEGAGLLERALRMGRPGAYQLQAAIAAVHDEAPAAEATDWRQILGLYGLLARQAPSPVVDLNRAVALAMVGGPAAGLAAMDVARLDEALGSYRFYHAARAELCRRLGHWAEAATAYRRALALEPTLPERAFLERRLAATERRGLDG